MNKPKTETWYCWKEWAYVAGEEGKRLLTPWGDPEKYDFPFDFLYSTPDAARQGLKDMGGDPDWVLCKMTLEPL